MKKMHGTISSSHSKNLNAEGQQKRSLNINSSSSNIMPKVSIGGNGSNGGNRFLTIGVKKNKEENKNRASSAGKKSAIPIAPKIKKKL